MNTLVLFMQTVLTLMLETVAIMPTFFVAIAITIVLLIPGKPGHMKCACQPPCKAMYRQVCAARNPRLAAHLHSVYHAHRPQEAVAFS
jgi:hypothetical protein